LFSAICAKESQLTDVCPKTLKESKQAKVATKYFII